jgi:probable F420-dependent oxidoreductase
MARHAFRFGVINEHMTTRPAWIDAARRAESLGYATFLIRDHFVPDFFGDQFAPIAALMAAADATTTLRIGSLVIDNDFRHPALLAKEAATLDLLSDGRFELGLGAGWLRTEYDKAGLAFDAPGVRITRLEEAIQIVKGLFADQPLTFSGQHYTVSQLNGYPKPVQRPHPPILIGGGGKRILSLAGREADIVGILTTSVTTGALVVDPLERITANVQQKIEWVRAAAGDRFDAIELSLVADLVIADDRRAATERLIQERGWSGVSVEQVWDMPAVFVGSIDQIVADMQERRETLGVSLYVLSDADTETCAPIVAKLTGG